MKHRRRNDLNVLAVRMIAMLLAVSLLTACGGGSSDTSGGRGAPIYRIEGTFTGLAQGTVILSNGLDTIELETQEDGIIRDISFAFEPGLPAGAEYNVQVASAGSNVSCEVTNGSGTVPQHDVKDILVQCFSTPSLRLLAGRLPRPDVDGIAASIGFTAAAVAVARDGSIYLGTDEGMGHDRPLLRRITRTGFLTTIAGGAVGPAVDGTGDQAGLIRPRALTEAPDGTFFVFGDGTAVRRVDPDGKLDRERSPRHAHRRTRARSRGGPVH